MENEIYFRDYKDEYQKKQKSLESRFSESVLTHAEENGFFKAYEAAWREIPKAILPQSKANYENGMRLSIWCFRLLSLPVQMKWKCWHL